MKITLTGIFSGTDKYTIDFDWVENIYDNSIWTHTVDNETKKQNIVQHEGGCTIVEFIKPNIKKYMYLRVKESKKDIERMLNDN